MKKTLRRLLGLTCLATAVLAAYAWFHWSPAGETFPAAELADISLPYRLRSVDEHNAAKVRNGGEPYILKIDDIERGELIYFGATHSNDRAHPQVEQIIELWDQQQPTVALYEGRSRGYFYGMLIEPFAGLPEPALVHKLARRHDTRLITLEPNYADEVAELLNTYSPEQVALYFFLRVYRSESGGVANDSLAAHLLGKRTDVDGLRDALSSLQRVDELWARDFADAEAWRTNRHEIGYLAQISQDSRRIRGEHMARLLIHLVNQGERVFAVVGSGHVIRQEWNLRASFDQVPAWDQPTL